MVQISHQCFGMVSWAMQRTWHEFKSPASRAWINLKRWSVIVTDMWAGETNMSAYRNCGISAECNTSQHFGKCYWT